LYLADQAPGVWNAFVSSMSAQGQPCPAPCSQWPSFPGSISVAFSDGVATTVANDALGVGSIGYVEAGFAFGRGFPVANLHNASGNYAQPTSVNVATALQHATLNADLTQNLAAVYRAPEANAYPMSSYSYMILPCVAPSSDVASCSPTAPATFGPDKGFVLGTWIIYIMCAGQRSAAPLGYSPLPPNLVAAGMAAVNRLPGHPATPPLDYQHCPNPTFTRSAAIAGPTVVGQSGGGQTTSSTAAGQTGTTAGHANSAANGSSDTSALPPGTVRVSVVDSAARSHMLDAAVASAARTDPPSRAPLWGAMLILLGAVFSPMLFVTARGRISSG
jgi:phosphate transport system substrate-binding protein